MIRLLLAAAACALLAPSVTSAQLSLGAQAGIALPFGDVHGGVKVSDEVARAFPLELRATWRLAPAISVGLQGGYEVASAADLRTKECDRTGTTCSQHLWRVAARGEYAFGGEKWLPYVAATLGWEWESLRWELTGDNWERTLRSGWLLGGEAGIDHPTRPGSRFRIGGYAGLWLAQYLTRSVKGENAGYAYADSGTVPSSAVHGWFGVGIRGTYDFAGFQQRGAAPPPQ